MTSDYCEFLGGAKFGDMRGDDEGIPLHLQLIPGKASYRPGRWFSLSRAEKLLEIEWMYRDLQK